MARSLRDLQCFFVLFFFVFCGVLSQSSLKKSFEFSSFGNVDSRNALHVLNEFAGDIVWKKANVNSIKIDVEVTGSSSEALNKVVFEVKDEDMLKELKITPKKVEKEPEEDESVASRMGSLFQLIFPLLFCFFLPKGQFQWALFAIFCAISCYYVVANDETTVNITIYVPAQQQLGFLKLSSNKGTVRVDIDESPSSKVEFPVCSSEGETCPNCCSGQGSCSKGTCSCDDGFFGSDCSQAEPQEIQTARSQFPQDFSLKDYIVFQNIPVITGSSSNGEGVYVFNNNTWTLISSGPFSTLFSDPLQTLLYVYRYRGKQIFKFSNDTNSVERWDTQTNGPSEINNLFIGTNYVMTAKDTTNPELHILELSTGTWTNTNFDFKNLDGKPHINMYDDSEKNQKIFYESNYSGTFMYDIGTGKWTKPTNVILDTNIFLRHAANPYWNNKELKPCASAISFDSEWKSIETGLPPSYSIDGFTTHNGLLWASVEDSILNGVYAFDGCRWWHVAFPPSGYGTNRIISVGGHLYAQGHGSLHRLTQDYNWVHAGEFFTVSSTKEVTAGNMTKSIYFFTGDTEAPKIWQITLDESTHYVSGTLTDTNFNQKGLDGKPHVEILEDKNGNVWYKSNYSGIFKRQPGGNWEKVSDRSGALSVGDDGIVYLSYEITPTTQLSTFFKYSNENNEHQWKQIHQTRGYGIGCKPLSQNGEVFCEGRRFGQFVIHDTKFWVVSSIHSGLGLNSDEIKGSSCRNYAIFNQVVFCDHTFSKNKENKRRLIASEPDISGSYYDSNLAISTGTYLGNSPGTAAAVKIMSNGKLLVALNSLHDFQGTQLSGNASDEAKVLIMNENATNIEAAFGLSGSILDLAIHDTDNSYFVVATTKAIEKITTGGSVSWSVSSASSKKRVSVAKNGNVFAMTNNNEFELFDSNGNSVWTKTTSRSYTEDVDIDSDNQLVFICGYDNKKLPSNLPVQVAFLQAFEMGDSSSLKWNLFGFDGKDLSNNIADTRLYRCSLGRDGHLYILGESAGSQTIFRYNGKVYEGKDILKKIDFYNDLWNTASAHEAYHAKVNAVTGEIVTAQLTMARLSDGKSNTFRVGDIAGDEEGRTYVVGKTAYTYANRDATTIEQVPVGQYNGDPSFLWLNGEFTNRLAWHSFIRDKYDDQQKKNYGGFIRAVDSRGEKAVLLAEIASGSESAIKNALFSSNDLAQEDDTSIVYISVIPTANR